SRSQGVATAAEELGASVREISERAGEAAADTDSAQASVQQGHNSVQEAISTMERIARAVHDAGKQVDTLAQASAQIGDIVNQIEAIAKQTNLLALNATIEAARAGDAGKGFTVVAGEVKNLANQTARATIDIRTRIESLRTEMSRIVISMAESASMVTAGQEVVKATGQAVNDVAHQISHAGLKITEISAILTQQTAASNDVSQNINVIADEVIEQKKMVSALMAILSTTDTTTSASIPELMKLELKDKTIHVAKSDHMIWRRKLAEMLVGRVSLNPQELADHHTCRLGKWYGGINEPSIRNHPAYAALEGPHRDVHALGIEAAKQYQKGDIDSALKSVTFAGAASIPVIYFLNKLLQRDG
ncbi:MAG: CZB domain-containing protein, partial [Alphaproteobacteria bacterium]|nr:CZB domain-containing protein [Alphaproteobacteria bacterium]